MDLEGLFHHSQKKACSCVGYVLKKGRANRLIYKIVALIPFCSKCKVA